ncbi:MAG TPA: PLAT/LH2 domain-containing protein, partial [Candidatus Paceibacterota bacterium]
ITLYQNINYGGTSQTFTGGFYPNFVDLGINDWASSIKFGPAPPPPPPSNYNLNVNSSGYSGISVSSSTGHSGTTNYTKSVSSGANVNLRSLIGVINVQGGNNHYFTSWSGSSACLDTNYEITFSMPASNTTCTTNFVSTCGNLSLYNSNNLGGGCEGYSDSWSFINGGKNSGATKNNFTAFVFPNANFSGGYWKITQNSTLRFPSNSIYSAIVSGSGPDEVRVTTGTDNGAGTDDRVYLKVYNVETGWRYIHLDKNGDDFENGNVDTYTTSNNTNGDPVVIGPGDTHFRMYKSPDGTSFGDWKLQHWSATDNGQVIINDSHNGWLNDQTTQTPERVRCYHSIGGPGTTC